MESFTKPKKGLKIQRGREYHIETTTFRFSADGKEFLGTITIVLNTSNLEEGLDILMTNAERRCGPALRYTITIGNVVFQDNMWVKRKDNFEIVFTKSIPVG